MASSPADILSPDGALIGGPDDHVKYALGEDQLETLFSENPEYIVVDLLEGCEVALRALDQFNKSGSPRPAIADHTQVKLFDPEEPKKISLTYALRLDDLPPFRARYLLLPFQLSELPPPAPPGRDLLDQLSALSEEAEMGEIVLVLDGMILDREIALSMLRDLVGMHRDAVQNAVDIVQTKRVDFLENPEESSLLDYAFGLVMGGLAAAMVSSALGVLLGLVSRGVFTVLGRGLLAERKSNISTLIGQRTGVLNQKTRDLARIRPLPTESRNAAKRKARNSAALKAEILVMKAGNEKANRELDLTWGRIAADAHIRSKEMRAHLNRPIRPDGTPDPLYEYGARIASEAEAKARERASAVEQTRADNAARPVALPVDVAMKMEVQNYFLPWLAAAEATIHYLKQARLTLLRNGELPRDAISEIVSLAAEAARLDAFAEEAASFTASSADPQADMTSSYELLLWLTMYRPRLSHVPQAWLPGRGLHVDRATGDLIEPSIDALTTDLGTRNLLRYLSQRFLGKGRMEGEGQDSELTFTREELIATHRWLESLCARLFRPGAVSPGDGPAGAALADAPREIRLATTKYEIWWVKEVLP